MINIFDYLDYRKFLKDFYQARKKEASFFSYRYFARRIGMDYSILIRITQNTLHLSSKKIGTVAEACELQGKQKEYFENLVRFNKAKSQSDCKLYFEKLLSLKSLKSDILLQSQYEFFNKWYYTALWTHLHQVPFKGNFSELGNRLDPPLSARDTRQAVKLLERLELVERDEKGFLRARGKNLTTGEEWRSLAIAQYQKTMIELGHESLERFQKQFRDISTVTINLPKEAVTEFREIIAEFRKSVIKMAESYSSPNDVYQMNIQLFPLTRVEI